VGGRARLFSLGVIAALAAVPLYAAAAGDASALDLGIRIMVFALAALSLDLILGFGGMISFGHAAYLGVGAYAVGILSHYGFTDGFLHLAVAIAASTAIAFLIGAVCLRTTGVYFIMITLAFAQMLFFLGVSLEKFGGDDGMTIWKPAHYGLFTAADRYALYYAVLGLLILGLAASLRLIDSRFGQVLRGAKSNERRMRALGYATYRYKLAAFTLAGAMCGLAGALLANLTSFVTPAYMAWTRSGELLVMVILGGIGSLAGPIVGSAALLMMEHVLSRVTQHWMLVLGPILVLLVLFAKRGIYGWFVREAR
jgi:branched-chain amino acid transport system permease protein